MQREPPRWPPSLCEEPSLSPSEGFLFLWKPLFMAHHKRQRPKHQRAGCLTCKPWKDDRGSKVGDGYAHEDKRTQHHAPHQRRKTQLDRDDGDGSFDP